MLTYFQLSLALIFLPTFIYKVFVQTAKGVFTLNWLLYNENNFFQDFDICDFYQFPATDKDMQSKRQNTARRNPSSPRKFYVIVSTLWMASSLKFYTRKKSMILAWHGIRIDWQEPV